MKVCIFHVWRTKKTITFISLPYVLDVPLCMTVCDLISWSCIVLVPQVNCHTIIESIYLTLSFNRNQDCLNSLILVFLITTYNIYFWIIITRVLFFRYRAPFRIPVRSPYLTYHYISMTVAINKDVCGSLSRICFRFCQSHIRYKKIAVNEKHIATLCLRPKCCPSWNANFLFNHASPLAKHL